MTLPASAKHSASTSRPWILITCCVAGLATCLDALLIEERYGFFTGGFLVVRHLTGSGDVGRFLAASFLADASIAGLSAALVLFASARLRLNTIAGWWLAFAVSLGPLCLADVVSYKVAAYLGDTLNASLLFDLAGRRVSEFLAVGAAHLQAPLLMTGGGSVLVIGLAWALHRATPGDRPNPRMRPRALALPVLLCLAGTSLTALIRHDSPLLDEGLRRKPSAQALGWLAGGLSDFDRDGYGWPADPAPRDPRIFPYALDVPGNGIDEDGVAGDLPIGDEYGEARPSKGPWTFRPDVVLVVLESFRADMVGAVENGIEVTPVMNRLAAAGVSARYAYSHNGYTSQSRRHIFSGSVANVRQGTLIDDFKANGYEVAYFSGQDESFGGPEYDVGFNRADVAYDARVEPEKRYSAYTTAGSLAVPFSVLQKRIQAFLAARSSGRPLFLYVNFEDTHFPYHHGGIQPILNKTPLAESRITPANAAALRAMYANTAANIDRAVGEVLDMVRRKQAKEPGIIISADHGESLFDDDGVLGHGVGLTDIQTRIPLIAAHLPITIEEPLGQSSLRDAIGDALSRTPSASSPVLRERRDAAVFQYLGTLARPAQIALTGADGRLIFDFRSNMVQLKGASDWREPQMLTGVDRAAYLDLVRTWERMLVAKQRAGR